MLCVLIRIAFMSTQNILLLKKVEEILLNHPLYASWPGATINTQWLELPLRRTSFLGLKSVRAIKVRL